MGLSRFVLSSLISLMFVWFVFCLTNRFVFEVYWEKKKAELEKCVGSWLLVDGEFAESYFKTVEAFVGFFVHGGKGRITEYKVKRMAERGFEDIENGERNRSENMQELYAALPQLPTQQGARRDAGVDQLFSIFSTYFHQLNWMRKCKGIELQENGLPDLDEDSDDE